MALVNLIKGEDVTVIYFQEVSKNPFGESERSETSELVHDVLVIPGATSDGVTQIRDEGVQVLYTLHFPKTFTRSLKDAQIKVRGITTHVVGDPDHYTLENTPGKWWMPVQVRRYDG